MSPWPLSCCLPAWPSAWAVAGSRHGKASEVLGNADLLHEAMLMIRNLQAQLAEVPAVVAKGVRLETESAEVERRQRRQIQLLQRQLEASQREGRALADQVRVLKSEQESMMPALERSQSIVQQCQQVRRRTEALEERNDALAKQFPSPDKMRRPIPLDLWDISVKGDVAEYNPTGLTPCGATRGEDQSTESVTPLSVEAKRVAAAALASLLLGS